MGSNGPGVAVQQQDQGRKTATAIAIECRGIGLLTASMAVILR
jgi:hypothetical protein